MISPEEGETGMRRNSAHSCSGTIPSVDRFKVGVRACVNEGRRILITLDNLSSCVLHLGSWNITYELLLLPDQY